MAKVPLPSAISRSFLDQSLATTHAFSHFWNARMALSISQSAQICSSTTFSSALVLGFGLKASFLNILIFFCSLFKLRCY